METGRVTRRGGFAGVRCQIDGRVPEEVPEEFDGAAIALVFPQPKRD